MTNNVLLNGNFDLWQRGTEFNDPPHFTPTADRFVFGQSSGAAKFKISRSADVPNLQSQSSIEFSVIASHSPLPGDEAHIRYSIEGREAVLAVAGKVVTFSFWAKSNLPGIYSITLVHPSASRTVEQTLALDYTILQSGAWEKKTITVDLSTVVGGWSYVTGTYGLKIRFAFYAGANYKVSPGSWVVGNYVASNNNVNLASAVGNYLRISQLKLEVGSDATPFMPVDITTELRRCQRYCFILGHPISIDSLGVTGYAGAAGETAYSTIPYPVSMARLPTISMAGAFATVNVVGTPTWTPGYSSALLKIAAAGAGRMAARSDKSVVIFDAEL